ncbi:MAG: DUF1194 domain-containing protein [Paracoccaceae bacterium]|nr:DUF1194 domain-containing protein [Paracoccaceae bacterium]
MGRLACLLTLGLWLSGGTAPAQQAEADLEIVFAVDASGSVDDEEFHLQIGGIVAALRDPKIQAAIRSGPTQRIAAALMIWSDAAYAKYKTDWFTLNSPESAERFAAEVQRLGTRLQTQRKIGGGTAIGDAIVHALEMMDGNGVTAIRRVIDVSGDGIETPPWAEPAPMLPEARQRAAAKGVMVNGLAITHDFPDLVAYYRDNVITGPGSFVVQALDFGDFKRAIREKMWREFSFIFARNDDAPIRGRLAFDSGD